MSEREILVQALRSCGKSQCGSCYYRGNGIACRQKLLEAAADELDIGLTKADTLAIWGLLQAYKDNLELKAKGAVSRAEELGQYVAADHLKTCAEISALQIRLCREEE